jgi:hypothetical protein
LLRFIVAGQVHRESQTAIGIVAVAYERAGSDEVSEAVRADLRRWLTWIEQHLDVPDRFNRTTSKGWYRRETRGICWLRTTASEHIMAFRALADVLVRCGCQVSELRETRVGYVIYEDDVQVVAEPFRDTRRG